MVQPPSLMVRSVLTPKALDRDELLEVLVRPPRSQLCHGFFFWANAVQAVVIVDK